MDGKLSAQILFQVIHRHALVPQPPLELVFGVRALEPGEFVLHFAVAGLQAQLFGAFEQNFIDDQLIENIQFQRKSFFLGRFLAFGIHAGAVIFVNIVALDFLAVNDGPNVGRMLRLLHATGHARERQGRQRQHSCAA